LRTPAAFVTRSSNNVDGSQSGSLHPATMSGSLLFGSTLDTEVVSATSSPYVQGMTSYATTRVSSSSTQSQPSPTTMVLPYDAVTDSHNLAGRLQEYIDVLSVYVVLQLLFMSDWLVHL
jgi:hypothetical protein